MRVAICLLISFIFLPTIASAKDWIRTTQQADRVFYRAQAAGRTLQLGCFKGSTSISFTLLGGSTPLFPDDGSERNLMIWIQHADGRMARVPIEAEYLAGEDNGLIASLQMGQTDKEFFAQASGLEVDVPLEGGRDLFKTGMAGSAAALADILRVCPNA